MNKTAYPANLHYPLDLARDFLQEQGLASTNGSEQGRSDEPVLADTPPAADDLTVLMQAARPVLDLGYTKVLQYLTTFQNEVYPMYPCIDLNMARNKIDALFALPSFSGTGAPQDVDLDLDLIDVELTKVTLAISKLVESDGENSSSSDLDAQLTWNMDVNFQQETVQIEDIMMATLMVRLPPSHNVRILGCAAGR